MSEPAPTRPNELEGLITELSQLVHLRHWASRLKVYSNSRAASQLLGGLQSPFRGRGMEFAEVRRYHAGDDIRTIDWKVTARTQKAHTKLFIEERERPCHILIDQRPTMFFGSQAAFKSVVAAEVGSALAWAGLSTGDRVGGQVLTLSGHDDSRAKRGKQAVLRLLHAINQANNTLYEHCVQTPQAQATPLLLSNGLRECQRLARPGSAVFIVSDFHDFCEASAESLITLSKHTDLTAIQITDPLEAELNLLGTYSISNGQAIERVSLTPSLRADYLAQRQTQAQMLDETLRRARARWLTISTADSVRARLLSAFGPRR